MASDLYELVYVSSAVRPMSLSELNALLAQSRQSNHERAVSGMLLYAEGTFLQVLEGEEDQVVNLYQQICKDPRHSHSLVIHEGRIGQRNFSDWKMGFRYLQLDDYQRVEGFTQLLNQNSSARQAFIANPNR